VWIEGQVWTAENLTIQIIKALNADAEKTGDLEKTEGNLLNETEVSTLVSSAPKSIAGLM